MKDLIHSLEHLVLEASVASSSQKRVGVCSLYLAEKGVIDYRYFLESGGGKLEAFLGTPVFHGGTLVGVIVVEQKFRRKFSREEESFLNTAAACLGDLDPDDFKSQGDGVLIDGASGGGGCGPMWCIVIVGNGCGYIELGGIQPA